MTISYNIQLKTKNSTNGNDRNYQRISYCINLVNFLPRGWGLVVTGAIVYGAGVRIALSEFSKTEQKIALYG